MFSVYMLHCSDDSYYIGQTDDLEKRVAAHQAGTHAGHTFGRRPVTLVWSEQFSSRAEALECERQVKRWSRIKEEALIRGDWGALSKDVQAHGV